MRETSNEWYDETNEYYDGAECPLCRQNFRRGEKVLEIGHYGIGKGFFILHESCLCRNFKYPEIDGFLDAVGFDVSEGVLD